MAKKQPEHLAKKGGSSGKILLIVGAVVIVALVVVIVVLLTGRNAEPAETASPEPTMRTTVVTRENVDEIVDEMASTEYVAPGYYNATMTTEWHFRDGTSVSEDAYVENKPENTNDVFFDVFLASDEEHAILSSPVIPRGASWDEIKLDTPLDAGTYDCVMIYHLIDADQNTVSTLRVGLTIIVEN